MGIRNREGALYIATGVDNTGLYTGRREAMGIIKAMASQITSFDVFGNYLSFFKCGRVFEYVSILLFPKTNHLFT